MLDMSPTSPLQVCGLLSHLEALHSQTAERSLHHNMEDLEQLLGEAIHSASSPGERMTT